MDKGRCGSVLVVEDDKDVRSVIALSLASWGYHVVEAGDGDLALACLEPAVAGRHPDVVVLDVNIPGAASLEVCRYVKSARHLVDVSVLVLTADGSDRQKIAMIEGGADDYLTKPFDVRELRGHVDSLVRMRLRHRVPFSQEAQPPHIQPDAVALASSPAQDLESLRMNGSRNLVEAARLLERAIVALDRGDSLGEARHCVTKARTIIVESIRD